MIKIKFITAFVVLFSTLNVYSQGIKFQDLTLEEAFVKAAKEDKFIFVDVYTVWCSPCKYLSKNVFTDEELGKYMNENYISIKVDAEKGNGPDIMDKYELTSYPSLLYFNPQGELANVVVGALESKPLLSKSMMVIDPLSAPLGKMRVKYENGDRSQEFLQSYLIEMISNGDDIESYAKDYFSRYDLSLEDEDDFLIFYMGNDEINDPMVQKFLKNPKNYIDINQDLSTRKYDAILKSLLMKSIDEADRTIVTDEIDLLYPVIEFMFPDETVSKEEFKEMLLAPLIENGL